MGLQQDIRGYIPAPQPLPLPVNTFPGIVGGMPGLGESHRPKPVLEMDLPIDPNEPTYCFCNRVSFGEMIACDNDHCKVRQRSPP